MSGFSTTPRSQGEVGGEEFGGCAEQLQAILREPLRVEDEGLIAAFARAHPEQVRGAVIIDKRVGVDGADHLVAARADLADEGFRRVVPVRAFGLVTHRAQ